MNLFTLQRISNSNECHLENERQFNFTFADVAVSDSRFFVFVFALWQSRCQTFWREWILREQIGKSPSVESVALWPTDKFVFPHIPVPFFVCTSNLLIIMKKPLKKDVYNLGRHKVIEYDKTENVQEVRLAVSQIDETQKCKKVCMLRDFW